MLGWNTGFESIMPRGHEILTEGAVGARGPGAGGRLTFTVKGQPITTIVTPAEVTAIVEGNRAIRRGQSRVLLCRRHAFRSN